MSSEGWEGDRMTETVSEEQLERLRLMVEEPERSRSNSNFFIYNRFDQKAISALLADHAAGKERKKGLREALLLISRGNDVHSAKIALAALAEERKPQ